LRQMHAVVGIQGIWVVLAREQQAERFLHRLQANCLISSVSLLLTVVTGSPHTDVQYYVPLSVCPLLMPFLLQLAEGRCVPRSDDGEVSPEGRRQR